MAAMPPLTKETLNELIGDEHVREELRKVADPSTPYASPVFLHGQPLAGNSSKYPVAMGLIDPTARIVSIQPTDQAASWASQRAQNWAPNDTIGHVPLWETFDTQAITRPKLSFVSARQVLGHGLAILEGAKIIIVDEVHYQPVDHELAIARVRQWVKSGDLPNARIVLMSSYMPPTSSSPPLFPDLSHVQLGGGQRVSDMGHCTFGEATGEGTTEGLFVSFVTETLGGRIDAGDGPVLVFVPGSNCITKLMESLKGKAKWVKKHGPDDKVKEKWQVRLFTNLGDNFSADDLGRVYLDGKSIVISPPFFDKCHSKLGDAARFKHVICPHWMICDRFDKVLGQDVPCGALLSKSEMCFLAFHAEKAWLACARATWARASDRDSAEAERVAPTEYLIKAAVAFPGLAPYPVHRAFWSLHQLRYAALMQIIDMDKNGMVLTPRGEDVVRHMLDTGLRLRGAVFLQCAVTIEHDTSDDKESCGPSLLNLAIPLAVTIGQGCPVLQYKWNARSDEHRLGVLSSAVEKVCTDNEIPNLPGVRKYGDDLLHAWLLVGYLAGGTKPPAGASIWICTIPRHLQDVVAHIRNSLTGTATSASQGYRALAGIIARTMEKPSAPPGAAGLAELFHQCIYGAGLMNVACVLGREVSHGKAIGYAENFNGAANVLLSQGSALDMEGMEDEIYVTFGRIETIPRDADTGAEYMISGLSPLTVKVMSDAHLYFTVIDSWDPEEDSIQANIEYTYNIFEP